MLTLQVGEKLDEELGISEVADFEHVTVEDLQQGAGLKIVVARKLMRSWHSWLNRADADRTAPPS